MNQADVDSLFDESNEDNQIDEYFPDINAKMFTAVINNDLEVLQILFNQSIIPDVNKRYYSQHRHPLYGGPHNSSVQLMFGMAEPKQMNDEKWTMLVIT